MSQGKFKFGEMLDVEEMYMEGYPSAFGNVEVLEDPEFVLYLKEFPEHRFGSMNVNKTGLNELIHSLMIRAGLATEGNVKDQCDSIGPILVIEDKVTAKTITLPYYRIN